MMSEGDGYPGFAPEHDAPIPYMQRIRDYYQALGYGAPYRWAHYAEVPFAPLEKPLAECRVALVTTAAPYQPDKGDQGPGAPYNARRQVLHASIPATPPSITICASRMSAIDRDAHRRPRTATPGSRCRRCAAARRRADRRGRAALSRRADQPQPSRDDRPGLPGVAGALPRRRASTPPSSSPIDRCVTRP